MALTPVVTSRYTPGMATLSVKVDDAVKDKVKAAAAADRRTVSNWVAVLIERALAEQETGK